MSVKTILDVLDVLVMVGSFLEPCFMTMTAVEIQGKVNLRFLRTHPKIALPLVLRLNRPPALLRPR